MHFSKHWRLLVLSKTASYANGIIFNENFFPTSQSNRLFACLFTAYSLFFIKYRNFFNTLVFLRKSMFICYLKNVFWRSHVVFMWQKMFSLLNIHWAKTYWHCLISFSCSVFTKTKILKQKVSDTLVSNMAIQWSKTCVNI